jgi:hypothetical protein
MALHKMLVVSVLVWLLTPAVALSAIRNAVVTNEQRVYRDPRLDSKVVGRVGIGEEIAVTGRTTTMLEVSLSDQRAGWTLANGVILLDENPHAAALLFEAADDLAQDESQESWRSAARLFRKAAEADCGPGLQPVAPTHSPQAQAISPCHSYAAEAAFRAAELAWRLEIREAGAASEKGSLAEVAAVTRTYPKTAGAARAAFLLVRNGLCEYWDGTPGCPEAEIGPISKYLEQYPNSPHALEARYAIAYRHAALVEIYLAEDKPYFSTPKAADHRAKAQAAAEALVHDCPGTPLAARSEHLLWSLGNNVGVYSAIEVALRRF